jgi:transposase-like protein
MYALGLSTKAIQENLKDIYNVDVSPEVISRVTDGVKGLVEERRNLLSPAPWSSCGNTGSLRLFT